MIEGRVGVQNDWLATYRRTRLTRNVLVQNQTLGGHQVPTVLVDTSEVHEVYFHR